MQKINLEFSFIYSLVFSESKYILCKTISQMSKSIKILEGLENFKRTGVPFSDKFD